MTQFYVFNGDADGLCALQQLRLIDSAAGVLVTGVKRDIQLLRHVDAVAGDAVTVLDISLHSNHESLIKLLDRGVSIRYFDHHYAGTLPQHRNFEPHIDESTDVCTSILVDRFCESRHRSWAIAAAFGDSLDKVAYSMAESAGIDSKATATLMELGRCLNYNAYGEVVGDLHFDPAQLAELILPFEDPLEFVRCSTAYSKLAFGYAEDMQMIRQLKPASQGHDSTLFVLPGEAWARRAVGVFANEWVSAHPGKALAIMSPKSCGNFTISVRVPAGSAISADAFCRGFDTGGGRKLAGGINHLPASEANVFVKRFHDCFDGIQT